MALLGVLAVVVFWGANFAALKLALNQLPPLLTTGLRFIFAALLFVWFAKPTRQQMRVILLLGMVLGCGHFGLIFIGISGTDVAVAAIAMQLGIPFSVLLARFWLGERFGWQRTMGLCMAFVGVGVLAGEPKTASSWPYVLAVVGAAFSWAVANILMKRIHGLHVVSLSGWVGLVAAPMILLASFALEDNQMGALMAADWKAWAGIGYAVIFSTGIAYAVWFHLLDRYPVGTVVPFNLLVPVFGLLFGVLLLGESLGLPELLGAATTLSGVAIITFYRRPAETTGTDNGTEGKPS